MAKVKTPAPKKKLPPNGKKKNRQTNGHGDHHEHNGNGHDHDHNRPVRTPSNGNGKKTKGTVNWFSHWEKDHKGKEITVDFPHENCTKEEFKRLVKNYAKAWLDMYNIYLPQEKRNRLIMGKFDFKFEEKVPDAKVKTYRVKVKAYLDPDPETERKIDRDHHGAGDIGAGHLIPPEPPPPPPDSSMGG